jgi:hypothetical protein
VVDGGEDEAEEAGGVGKPRNSEPATKVTVVFESDGEDIEDQNRIESYNMDSGDDPEDKVCDFRLVEED